jgi:hypothetical protein
MSDAVTLARNARESLARGLNALQGEPNVPRHLVDLAAPIAQAMGALHQIERSGGAHVTSSAQVALGHLQSALAQLQAQPPQHPAVSAAMEAVAGALGGVHSLARIGTQATVAAEPMAPSPAAQPIPAPAQALRSPPMRPQSGPTPAPAPAARPGPPPAALAAPPAPAAPAPAAAAPPLRPAATPGRTPAADLGPVTAELGAHSPSNFYKGLSGNDIIDHGGLFVSTYKLPKIGQPVRLRVSLPGGYEFEANGVVRWRREASDGNDAPPGFGAQFTEITAEARQLVYRYVRNREPLFHDDL